MAPICPLCQNNDSELYEKDRVRWYHQCLKCFLLFVPSEYHVTFQAEKERYDCHNNDPKDLGYRKFLGQLAHPLAKFLRQPSHGIDFGSGPTPVLSELLEAEGFQMSNFDPFFANNPFLISRKYDFLTCSEVVEHFRNPQKEWKRMVDMVKKNGLIAIMTETFNEEIPFHSWYYKSDKTHICFYSEKTFEWIAKQFKLKTLYIKQPVRIFKKT